MKIYGWLFVAFIFLIALSGCGKKETVMEEMQEPMSIEAISSISATAPVTLPQKTADVQKAKGAQPQVALPAAQPQAAFNKPSEREIQQALQNAGYYSGPIDGKIGPLTKKAIEDFQSANNLQADGKVGPKTWAVLSVYLNTPAPASVKDAPIKPSKKN
ncbi:MAG: peptidoglycan-binding protein [Candidatus Omnitrophica bacterium]|nr:peptidoglycan-binding protein [Candidatus Omnitrophota bacterium]